MSVIKTISISAAGLLLASLASAQSASTFESLDKNSDGKITIQEATTHDELFVAFKKLDANKDGALTKEEFSAFSKK